jgi:outer membrane autotransporter protein
VGGFGGGNGAVFGTGGGAGLGGAIFVQQGGTLNIAGAFNVGDSSVRGGTAGGAGTNGSGLGSGIFLQGNGTVNFAPGVGVVQILSSGIADQTGSGGTGANAGSWVLAKSGAGTLVLQEASTYSGGTTITGGLINFTAANNLGIGRIALNGGGLQWVSGNIADISAQLAPIGAGGAIFDTNGNNVSFASPVGGTGGLTKAGAGRLTLMAANTYTGATMVSAGTLAVNGSIASNVTVGSGGTLGGSGVIAGNVTVQGVLAPGNSIGTLTVNGNYTQSAASTYQVEVNAAGQSDKLNVTGGATINGGTVAVQAQSGAYARNTTYTILTAAGGVSGSYADVTSNFAFLRPTLSYDANNAYLSLFLYAGAFAAGAQTTNQYAVGAMLDQVSATATGDLGTVVNALSLLSTQQGAYALNQISGQPYADFGSFNVANNVMFMNALGQQMALARGGQGSGQRQALAEACDIAACDGASPFSVWGSVLGGVGSVQGNGNSNTFTYNLGGTAAGIDYRVNPSLLVGLGAGFTSGTQWVDSFQGRGWSNTVSVAAYASFMQSAFYLDALAGYAYSNNQLQRQISIPNLQPRTANGSAGADQFLAQAEAGYKIGIYAPAAASVTPFARFQTSSINQAAFNEWGANSLSLNVQQQTTTSVRTIFGAELAGAIGLGDTRTLDIGLRLGWLHEYASTARPITAAFAGAPSANFTVYGATPQRDAAVIGFQAATAATNGAQIYLRYDGDIGSGTDNHALNLGVRLSF